MLKGNKKRKKITRNGKNKISIMKQILNEKGSGNKMGILDRLKRGKRISKEECSGIVSNAKKNSMTAVEYAKSFKRNLITLR